MPLKYKDQFPRFTNLAIEVAQQRIASSPSKLGMKQVRERFVLGLARPPGYQAGRSAR
jgi:hypothetical protein